MGANRHMAVSRNMAGSRSTDRDSPVRTASPSPDPTASPSPPSPSDSPHYPPFYFFKEKATFIRCTYLPPFLGPSMCSGVWA